TEIIQNQTGCYPDEGPHVIRCEAHGTPWPCETLAALVAAAEDDVDDDDEEAEWAALEAEWAHLAVVSPLAVALERLAARVDTERACHRGPLLRDRRVRADRRPPLAHDRRPRGGDDPRRGADRPPRDPHVR